MKILLFGVTNVGKTTIAKKLSRKMKYQFDDLDEEIKRRYKRIDDFQAQYPFLYERHKKRGEMLEEIVNKYVDNVVIAVSPIWYTRFFRKIINREDVLAIELKDKPENILKRLVYADENDKVHKLIIRNQEEELYYLNDIQKDIDYYKKISEKISYKFDIDGRTANDATEELMKYVEQILVNINKKKVGE